MIGQEVTFVDGMEARTAFQNFADTQVVPCPFCANLAFNIACGWRRWA